MKHRTSQLLLSSFILLLIALQQGNTQTIQNIRIVPPFPTTMDDVSILIDQIYTSGPCDLEFVQHQVIGSYIRADVYHCPGILTVICPVTDTILLGQLPAGTYLIDARTFIGGMFPCTTFTAGDSMLVSFSVTDNTGVREELANSNPQVHQNINTGNYYLSGKKGLNYSIEIFDVNGRLVHTSSCSNGDVLKLSDLAPGVYLYRIRDAAANIFSGKIDLRR